MNRFIDYFEEISVIAFFLMILGGAYLYYLIGGKRRIA